MCISGAACIRFVGAQDLPEGLVPQAVISRIDITGNRVHDDVIRSRLALREGSVYTSTAAAQTLEKLYALRLFKSIEIATAPAPGGALAVTVHARDGWFILPWPMAGSRGGVRYGAGMLFAQNILRRAERVIVFAHYAQDSSFQSFMLSLPGFSLSGFSDDRSFTEYRYADGGYNAKPFIGEDLGTEGRYGTVSERYGRTGSGMRLQASMPLAAGVTASAGFMAARAAVLGSGAPSEGFGRSHALLAGISLGAAGAGREGFADLGRIVGLGMADMKENLKMLDRGRIEHGLQAASEFGSPAVGSEHDYGKYTIALTRSVLSRRRDQLVLSCKAGMGSHIPFSQRFATSRRDGLIGVYAREYRGESIVMGSARLRHPFVRDRIGRLEGEVFGEYAVCPHGGSGRAREGVGGSVSYQFWRFPLPLGMGYTYSIDDSDWQATFAVGGMF